MSGLSLSKDYSIAFLIQVSRKMGKLKNQELRLRCLRVILAILKRQPNLQIEGELRKSLLHGSTIWDDLELTST